MPLRPWSEAVGVGPAGGFADLLGQGQGTAAGGVLLESVVLLDDFDVVVLAEHGGGLADEREQDVHADAHVRAVEDGDLAGGGFDRLVLGVAQAGRSHDQGDAICGAFGQGLIGGLRHGEVDGYVCLGGPGAVYGEIEASDPRQKARIFAGVRVIRLFDSANRHQIVRIPRPRQQFAGPSGPPHPQPPTSIPSETPCTHNGLRFARNITIHVPS